MATQDKMQNKVKKAEKLCAKLLSNARTIGFAVATREGVDYGQIPFVRQNGCFYIYASHLSSPIQAILAGAAIQFILIEDEAIAQNIWARTRLKFNAKINEI